MFPVERILVRGGGPAKLQKEGRFHTEATEKGKPRRATEEGKNALRAQRLITISVALRGFDLSVLRVKPAFFYR